jgi:protein-L-isoaspartate(D-aspartate) O-methyltransferase
MIPDELLNKVPRQLFIPDVIWIRRDDGWAVPLDRRDDPDRWMEEVTSADSVVTQVDDGATEKGTWPTSSCSAPSIVRAMLELLDVHPGMRVLEIGTGTGWNAALLAELAGPENVTTVEIDPRLAEQATSHLDSAGYTVRVVAGDGEDGWRPNAPYDRIIATAAVCELPYTWVEQSRPGALILAPWGPTFHPDEPLALLTVRDDGTAEGRFLRPAWFMPLRSQRVSQATRQATQERWEKAGRPGVDRFGITVTPDGQRIWLDEPSQLART